VRVRPAQFSAFYGCLLGFGVAWEYTVAECWQPSLDRRSADAPTEARILVKVWVRPSGVVGDVAVISTTPGYSALPRGVVAVVRSAMFPRGSSETFVNVPFVFQTRAPGAQRAN
jgi:hypothetical protein